MTNETSWSEEFAPPSLQEAADHLASQTEQQIEADLEADFESFAGSQLMIRSKSGEIKPLVFNAAQRHIHDRIEAQRKSTGKVRALILKGRQQGWRRGSITARRKRAASAPSSGLQKELNPCGGGATGRAGRHWLR